ncbi:epoxide hydrolase family protein [Pseudomonas umsongensis]|uniref:epoxide hydrolase family protein n=1 Tax=Pseudomonas umsongensis TaxID=198618 RepID=UPI00200B1264|nr:epoxide hydrolase family protein [Pseudomonas umsongensis]MCK8682725.1 epoxide hydrolase [Pseudomonas umsongensis]
MQLPGIPFKINTPEPLLDDLRARLINTRWPNQPVDSTWEYGTDSVYLQRLVQFWARDFDWQAWEARINAFEQRLVEVDGQVVHVLIEQGSGDNPLPLLLTHGWPGSFLEFIDLIEPLAHPERFGGRVEDAFTVVLPSLPGYGFSPSPATPLGPRAIARLWGKLASEELGFKQYVAQGGDWGSVVTGLMSRQQPPGLRAVHLNMCGNVPVIGPDESLAPEEQTWFGRVAAMQMQEGAYQQIQGTKPQSLAYGLTDSPAGLAGWICEKFQSWTLGASDQDPPFSLDWMAANLTLYWLNGINGANWLYHAARSGQDSRVAIEERNTVPAGFSLFPNDLIAPPPRCLLERIFDVHHYRVFDSGGHFPALEKGPLFVDELRRFFADFR